MLLQTSAKLESQAAECQDRRTANAADLAAIASEMILLEARRAAAERLRVDLTREREQKLAEAAAAEMFELDRMQSQSAYRENILSDGSFINGLVRRTVWHQNREILDAMGEMVHASQESWDGDEHWLEEVQRFEKLGIQQLVGNRKEFWREVVTRVWEEVGKLDLHLGTTPVKAEEAKDNGAAAERTIKDVGVEQHIDDSEESASEASGEIAEQGHMDIDEGRDAIMNAHLMPAVEATPEQNTEAQALADTGGESIEEFAGEVSGEMDVQGHIGIIVGHNIRMDPRPTPAQSTTPKPTTTETQLLPGPTLELDIGQENTNRGDDTYPRSTGAIGATPEPETETQSSAGSESDADVEMGEDSEDEFGEEARLEHDIGMGHDREDISESKAGQQDDQGPDAQQMDVDAGTEICAVMDTAALSSERSESGSTDVSRPGAGSIYNRYHARDPSSNPAVPSTRQYLSFGQWFAEYERGTWPKPLDLMPRYDESSSSRLTTSCTPPEAGSRSATPIDADTPWPWVKLATGTLMYRLNSYAWRKDLGGLTNALRCKRCREVLPKELRLISCHHLCCMPCLATMRSQAREKLQQRKVDIPNRSLVAVVCMARRCTKKFKTSVVVSEDLRQDWSRRLAVCRAAWEKPGETLSDYERWHANKDDNDRLELYHP